MALRSDWSHNPCPVARGVDAIGDPWVLLIIREALAGARRFDEFKRRLDIADNILAARLATMVAGGLLHTRAYSAGPRPRLEYVPSEAAQDAITVIQAYATWAHKHRPSELESPAFEILCGACGRASQRAETCEHCHHPLDARHGVTWKRPGPWQGELVSLADVAAPPR